MPCFDCCPPDDIDDVFSYISDDMGLDVYCVVPLPIDGHGDAIVDVGLKHPESHWDMSFKRLPGHIPCNDKTDV